MGCVQQSCEKTVVLICMYVFLIHILSLEKTYLLTKIVIVIVRCTKEMLIVIPKLFLRVTWCLFKFTYWFIKKNGKTDACHYFKIWRSFETKKINLFCKLKFIVVRIVVYKKNWSIFEEKSISGHQWLTFLK